MSLIPIHEEYQLVFPTFDFLTQFRSLIILIRDQNGVAIKVEFKHFCAYRSADDSYSLDLRAPSAVPGHYHWLYETEDSEFLIHFREWNENTGPGLDLKHFRIVTVGSVIDIVAAEGPIVSRRTDRIKGWSLRPGETPALPEKDIKELLL
jgi:hypothetical protein